MKNIIVAPVGRNLDALFTGLREFPTEKVILIATENNLEHAKKAKHDLDKFKVPSSIIEIRGDVWEETFKIIADMKKSTDKEILVNVSSGDEIAQCVALSAAFVNGLKAFGVNKNEVMMLPVLKFSYYRLIPEKKMKIIHFLSNNRDCCASFEEMSKKLGMSLPLLSYHVNGNIKSEGLKQMGLVETHNMKGRLEVKLTKLAELLLKGYIG
ncbi:MAG: winged helix-turn-helix transcriptional regulator [Candidatus Aenigmarchaeota archaeon]|nr:winged helix-turn-helix transcriptional regulator [Candidatus Aenigmarchaeota archaeon]MBI4174858.1 winged helix-turn-helix transcriptional regulator [Candidatus Aenigmarchaeota archaeon]